MRPFSFVRFPASLLALTALAGCSSLQSSDGFFAWITPYRIEVVQGNVLTQEQVGVIKPGQSRAQVRDVLGSPLLNDVFHADRWDYVFTIRRQGAEPQKRQIVAFFEGDTLKSLEGIETLPSERDFVNSIDTFKTSRRTKPLALSEAEIRALPAPPPRPAKAASSAAPEGPARTYPPLERP